MKNYILIAGILLLQVSCSNKNNTPNESNSPSNDSLLGVSTTRVSPESDYFQSFSAIKKNLDSLNSTQNRIYFKAKDQVEFSPNVVNEINEEISHLNALLLENKTTIQALNRRLNKQSKTNKTLQDSIFFLNQLLIENQGNLMDLKDMLYGANEDIRIMEAELNLLIPENDEQEAQIEKNMKEANTAHYMIGTVKELKEAHIINTEGGVFGMGQRPVLNNNLPTDGFTKIDFRNVMVLPINSKKAKLLTIHSTRSYQLEKDKNKVKQLTIIDPSEFWRVSKYLVIVKEN